jgi:hypothetical protein
VSFSALRSSVLLLGGFWSFLELFGLYLLIWDSGNGGSMCLTAVCHELMLYCARGMYLVYSPQRGVVPEN